MEHKLTILEALELVNQTNKDDEKDSDIKDD